jgi:antitoxin ParD1/3/4
MPTRNVVLTEHHLSMIERLVRSGRYQNASEVLREGLRLVERREREEKAKVKALREAARHEIASLERGAFKEFAGADELQSYFHDIGEQAIAAGASE